MNSAPLQTAFTVQEIEEALVAAAYVVRRHGLRYAPLMYRLQSELEKVKRDDPMAAADRILMAYTREGALKAIP